MNAEYIFKHEKTCRKSKLVKDKQYLVECTCRTGKYISRLLNIEQAARNVLNHCEHDCTMFEALRQALEEK